MDQQTPTSNYSPPQFNVWKSVQTIFSVAILVSTIFILWTPDNLLSNEFTEKMFLALQPQQDPQQINPILPTNRPRQKIGLVSGHKGNDSGAVCDDELTEAEVNLKIATLARDMLTDLGYEVEILDEFDKRLKLYEASVLVSIHNDSCKFINDQATGFKVAAAKSTLYPDRAVRLTDCLTTRYQQATGLPFHYNTITPDMTQYHSFEEINSNTPAAIIETGFLNLDRDLLVNQTDRVASGVVNGIVCFLRNESIEAIPTK